MRCRRLVPPLGALALVLSLSGSASAQTVYKIYVPVPGPGEHPTGLQRAAEKLEAELEANQGDQWEIQSPVPPVSSWSASELVVAVQIDPAYVHPDPQQSWGPTSYHMKSLAAVPYHVEIHTSTMQGGIEGLHGFRLLLMNNAYGNVLPLDEAVHPAFERRGFMVLIEEGGMTAADWRDYVDYHQLLGANVLTVGLPGLYVDTDKDDPTIDLPERFEADAYAARQAMLHCQDVGVRFQLVVAANGIHTPFYWEHYEPEQVLYDPDTFAHMVLTPADDPVGAEADHVIGGPGGTQHDYHDLLYYAASASLDKLAGNASPDPTSADLADLQADFYALFAEADAFLVVTTEGASDYSDNVVNGDGLDVIRNGFGWVSDRIADAGGTGDIVYWGWLHDLWFRARLDDHDYFDHPALAGFEANSYAEVLNQYALHDPQQPAEWVQEVGWFYSTLSIWAKVVVQGYGGVGSAPAQLLDPLGQLDVLSGGAFDKTAFLYWSHVERDLRNYLPRPAIRTTLIDQRAALRLLSLGGGWTGQSPANGIMGYRFTHPRRRPLNDYVVLRAASDERFLVADDANMDLDLDAVELEDAQDRMVDDLADFLSRGDPADRPFVRAALDLLDDSRPAVPTANHDVDLLRASLAQFYDNGVDWWNGARELRDTYPMLAFTYFVEKAAQVGEGGVDPVSGTTYEQYFQAAIRAARETPLLEQYSLGHEGQVRAAIEGLVAAFAF